MNAVSQLDREWSSLASGPLAEAFVRWQQREPLLRRFESPTALLRFLQSSEAAASDEPLRVLLELAAEDRLAGRLVLQALLPALDRSSRRVVQPRERHGELWELLLFFAWETICRSQGPSPSSTERQGVAAELTLRVLDDTRRELRRAEQPLGPACPASGRPLPASAA